MRTWPILALAACRAPAGSGFHPGVAPWVDTGDPTTDSAPTDDTGPDDSDDPSRHMGPPWACIRSVYADYGEPLGDTAPARGAPRPGPEPAHECRLWAAAAPALPAPLLRAHLVDLPDSLKHLGAANDDGWGLGWWAGADVPAVRRGEASAAEDPFFDDAVAEAMAAAPSIAVAHVRACSSGLCDLPNPHPFTMDLLGRTWLFGHNGTIDKPMLLSLIDPAFLAAHPPVNGADEEEWVDSELYLRLLLQWIAAYDSDVVEAIQHVIWLLHAGPGRVSGANFFLSDGQTVWAYRDGNSLYWFHDSYVAPCTAIASQHPTEESGRWNKLSDGQLVIAHPDGPPELLQIWWSGDAPQDPMD